MSLTLKEAESRPTLSLSPEDVAHLNTPCVRVQKLISKELQPHVLSIKDDSAGSCDGNYKLRIFVISDAFNGKTILASHRLVQAALAPMMSEIHAITIYSYSPSKFSAMTVEKLRDAGCWDMLVPRDLDDVQKSIQNPETDKKFAVFEAFHVSI